MNNDEITTILTAVLIVLFIVLVVLFVTFLVVRNKVKGPKDTSKKINTNDNNKKTAQNPQNAITYSKQSIFNFMNFDKIEDNMIVKKERQKYLMVIECQGINYDLMYK